MPIDQNTSVQELAATISQALEAASIPATLSGGAAVSIHTANRYQSRDLDFVTAERRGRIAEVLKPLGFSLAVDQLHFEHPDTDYYVEFPPRPLEFGRVTINHDDVPVMSTPWGPLRVITPTLCVMDRLIAYWAWQERQAWDQAVWVCTSGAQIDFEQLDAYAQAEVGFTSDIEALREANKAR